MAKKLPAYLDKIVDFMATEESSQMGTPKAQNFERFKSDLISESLTAKANPVGNENPTIKKFHEIEKILYPEFKASPLGRALSEKDGRVFFDDLRNFAVALAEKLIRQPFHGKTKRGSFITYSMFDTWAKNNQNRASGEYPIGNKKAFSKGERIENQAETEGFRYMRLLTQSIVIGLMRPIFAFKGQDFIDLLIETERGVPLKRMASVDGRREYIIRILNLMQDRMQMPVNKEAYSLGQTAPALPDFLLAQEKSKKPLSK